MRTTFPQLLLQHAAQRPQAPAIVYPEKFAGRSSAEKRGLVAKVMKDKEVLDKFVDPYGYDVIADTPKQFEAFFT